MNNKYFTSGNRVNSCRRVKNQKFEGQDKRNADRRVNSTTDELVLSLEDGIIKINKTPLLNYIAMDNKTDTQKFIGLISENQYVLARNSINTMLILPEDVRKGLYFRILKPGSLKTIETHSGIHWNEVANYHFPRLLVKVAQEELWVSNPVLRSDHANDKINQFQENSQQEINAALEKSLQKARIKQ